MVIWLILQARTVSGGILEEFFWEDFSQGANYDLLVLTKPQHHLYPRSKKSQTEHKNVNKCIEALRTAHRLLNDPGYLYIMDASRPCVVYGTAYNFYRTLRGVPTINWVSKRTSFEWKRILEEAGFEWQGTTRLAAHNSQSAAS